MRITFALFLTQFLNVLLDPRFDFLAFGEFSILPPLVFAVLLIVILPVIVVRNAFFLNESFSGNMTVLLKDGKESMGGGIVLDSQAHPFALCRFDIVAEGEADIYLAHVEVDVCDGRGKRKQTLKTSKLFAFARPWSPPPA